MQIFAETALTPVLRLNIYGPRKNGAGIAQLVEPYLAKVAVASSSLVSRSKICTFFYIAYANFGAGVVLSPNYPRFLLYSVCKFWSGVVLSPNYPRFLL